ncbi:Uncharacterised protein [Nocardia farcinica]|nr:Uncharacterised protein [Nocardia farcinica]
MPRPRIEEPDLPEYMTWEELEQLPAEIADQIELWDGRVVWVRRGPAEHQMFTVRMRNEIERCARKSMSEHPETCWKVDVETNVFLGTSGKSDFLTPDFLVHRCLGAPFQDVRAADTLLVGEVLSPADTHTDIEAKKGPLCRGRYSLVLGSGDRADGERDRDGAGVCPRDRTRPDSRGRAPAASGQLPAGRRMGAG